MQNAKLQRWNVSSMSIASHGGSYPQLTNEEFEADRQAVVDQTIALVRVAGSAVE